MPEPDLVLPSDLRAQLLVGVIFAESSTKFVGGENPGEKVAIGAAFVNCAYYAGVAKVGKQKCYNDSFGDGTLLGAIQSSSLAYNAPMWKKVMNGSRLKGPRTSPSSRRMISSTSSSASSRPRRSAPGRARWRWPSSAARSR